MHPRPAARRLWLGLAVIGAAAGGCGELIGAADYRTSGSGGGASGASGMSGAGSGASDRGAAGGASGSEVYAYADAECGSCFHEACRVLEACSQDPLCDAAESCFSECKLDDVDCPGAGASRVRRAAPDRAEGAASQVGCGTPSIARRAA